MAHLGDVADLIGGGTPSKSVSDYWSGDIPWASVRDLKARWLTSTEFKISQNAVEESSTHVIPSGQVVIATRVGLGKVVQLGQPTAINQDLRAIIPKNPQTLDPDFIYYWYLTVANDVLAAGQGATVLGVKVPYVASLEIPLPPLDEQKRIVAKLDEVHSFVRKRDENHQAEVAARKTLFMQVLRDIFLDRAISEEWTIRTFGDFSSHQLGKMLDKSKNSGELRPYLRNANIQWFRIDTSDILSMKIEDSERDRFRVRYGDLLICEGGYPGRCALWQDDSEMYFQKALHRARFDSIEAAKWAQYFLYFMTESGRLQEHFSGTGIMHLTGERLARLSIPIPETAELVSAVRTLDDLRLHLDALSEIQDAKGENLRNFNQRFAGDLLVGAS